MPICMFICLYTHTHTQRRGERERDPILSQILFWHKAVKETEKVLALMM